MPKPQKRTRYENPPGADAAVVDDVADAVLGLFGLESHIMWLIGILTTLMMQVKEASQRMYRATFTRPGLIWPGRSAALHILRQRNDAGYM